MAWYAVGGALALSCGGGGPVTPDENGPPEVASVALFAGTSDYTGHIVLVEGQPLRLEVRLYAANGDRIPAADGDFDVAFLFTPPDSFATVTPVPHAPLVKEVTPVARSGTPGKLMVVCDDRRLMLVRQFGPFEALVH